MIAAGQTGTSDRSDRSSQQAKISGCQLLPVNNIWNTPIDTLPVDANSQQYINTIGAADTVHADFGSGLWNGGPIGIPYTTVPGTQEKVNITFYYGDESDPGPYPIPPNAPIEGGSNGDGDRHVIVVDQDNCILYEIYDAWPQPDGSWEAGSGAIYDLKSNALRPAGWTSADAAGLPILPGLVRYEEVASGEINHALRFTAPQTRRKYIWPARHYASSLTGTQYPPMGQRFRLKANFDISGFSAKNQVILRALKKYGMFLADNGSSWFLSGAPDSRWNNDDLHQLDNIKGSDFEAVDESSLMISPNSGAALQGGTTNTITVISPNGGEQWTGGTTQNVTWTSSGTVGNVKIEYSTNNGTNWSTIVSSTANDGSYSWTVPAVSSSNCKVRISETDGDPSDTSDSVFSIVTASNPEITVTSPNGGEFWAIGSTHNVTWTTSGSVGNIMIMYSTNNGTNWSTIVSSTANDGSYSWTVPAASSSNCKVRISETDGDPSDTSDSVFSIVTASNPEITVTSPNGGEKWAVGSTHNVTWTTSGSVGNVRIKYSTNNGSSWKTVVSSTANDGSYSWKIPNTPSAHCKVRIREIDGVLKDASDSVFSIVSQSGAAEIFINRSQLNVGAVISGPSTGPQTFWVRNSGAGSLNWGISDNANWLTTYPSSGTDSGMVKVSVNPTGLGAGTYTGTITVTDPNATNSPQYVTVYLTVKNSSRELPPFGSFDTPGHGSTVRSSIAVTGWALDDIEVDSVKIYRRKGGDLTYIGDAVFVEGARTDVETAYPDYPFNYKAGWGYMLLTNFLPSHGNGTFTLAAVAADNSGNEVTLGTKTITVDNANAVKPFGAIDSPMQGGEASGSRFINWGWVLTPQPNRIPTSGSTIKVYVDGVKLGQPTYNLYRADIADLFPGYANSNGAAGYFSLDTTAYTDGVHTIQWVATDNAGNTDGIGSRYFTIQNSISASKGQEDLPPGSHLPYPADKSQQADFLTDNSTVRVIKGYNAFGHAQTIYADENENITIEIKELERVEIHLSEGTRGLAPLLQWTGYQEVNSQLRQLPIGSTLDREKGIFYWQPGPGFIGEYQLIFLAGDQSGMFTRKNMTIRIKSE